MFSLTFSLDQVKSAPPEVRHWIEREAAAALAALSPPEPGPSHTLRGRYRPALCQRRQRFTS